MIIVIKFKFIIVFLFFFIILSYGSLAYDLRCDIKVSPFQFEDIVTTKSIRVETKITNTGNVEFPLSTVSVRIISPNEKLLEDYYTYSYSTKALPPLQTESYEKPYAYGNDSFSVFETPIAGTWEVLIQLTSLPKDNVTYTESDNVVRTNGECRKYFSVKEFSQYEQDKTNQKLQLTSIEFASKSDFLAQSMLVLTILLLLIEMLHLIKDNEEYFERGIKDHKYYLFLVVLTLIFSMALIAGLITNVTLGLLSFLVWPLLFFVVLVCLKLISNLVGKLVGSP